jgi:putative ABC transport system ATP-binding protein
MMALNGTDATATAPLITLRDIRLTLVGGAGPVNILRGIDLEIGERERVAIIGPSGSGKSSLLSIMAGLERATGGDIRINGAILGKLNEDALARFRRDTMGIVFQSFHLLPTMTALENVAVPLELAGRRDAFDLARAELEAVGLGGRLDHDPAQLSGGEQQRVALARAVAGTPRLVLADEPTGNLDGATGGRIVELLFETCRRRGATLVLVTHDPALAERCDRVVRMADGRIEA